MKKLILLMSIFGIFILASCNDGTDYIYDDSSNSSNPTTEVEPIDTGDNKEEQKSGNQTNNATDSSSNNNQTNDSNQNVDSGQNNENQNTEPENKDDSVYDDGIEWGPLH